MNDSDPQPGDKVARPQGGGVVAKYARRVAPALVGALALWCAAPAVASTEWTRNGVAITAAKKVLRSGTIDVLDRPSGLFFELTCQDTGKGVVKPGTGGEITELSFSKCQKVTGPPSCEAGVAIEALHLPWTTELAFEEGAVREHYQNSGKGTPELVLKCEEFKKLVGVDWCVIHAYTKMTNTEAGVNAVLPAAWPNHAIACTNSVGAQFEGAENERSQLISLEEVGRLGIRHE
jgi:hypothetical protein